jgi:hypothetical protein
MALPIAAAFALPSVSSEGSRSPVIAGSPSNFERLLAVLGDEQPPSAVQRSSSDSSSNSSNSSDASSGDNAANSTTRYDGFISYRHQTMNDGTFDTPPFGITAAGMFRLVAEKFNMRLWQDV